MRPAAAAVKAQDELAMLGLDGGPRRPTETDIRAKGDCEGARIAQNRRAPTPGAGKSPFSLDKDLSWMPHA